MPMAVFSSILRVDLVVMSSSAAEKVPVRAVAPPWTLFSRPISCRAFKSRRTVASEAPRAWVSSVTVTAFFRASMFNICW